MTGSGASSPLASMRRDRLLAHAKHDPITAPAALHAHDRGPRPPGRFQSNTHLGVEPSRDPHRTRGFTRTLEGGSAAALGGHRVLLLTTTGRHTGRKRRTPVSTSASPPCDG